MFRPLIMYLKASCFCFLCLLLCGLANDYVLRVQLKSAFTSNALVGNNNSINTLPNKTLHLVEQLHSAMQYVGFTRSMYSLTKGIYLRGTQEPIEAIFKIHFERPSSGLTRENTTRLINHGIEVTNVHAITGPYQINASNILGHCDKLSSFPSPKLSPLSAKLYWGDQRRRLVESAIYECRLEKFIESFKVHCNEQSEEFLNLVISIFLNYAEIHDVFPDSDSKISTLLSCIEKYLEKQMTFNWISGVQVETEEPAVTAYAYTFTVIVNPKGLEAVQIYAKDKQWTTEYDVLKREICTTLENSVQTMYPTAWTSFLFCSAERHSQKDQKTVCSAELHFAADHLSTLASGNRSDFAIKLVRAVNEGIKNDLSKLIESVKYGVTLEGSFQIHAVKMKLDESSFSQSAQEMILDKRSNLHKRTEHLLFNKISHILSQLNLGLTIMDIRFQSFSRGENDSLQANLWIFFSHQEAFGYNTRILTDLLNEGILVEASKTLAPNFIISSHTEPAGADDITYFEDISITGSCGAHHRVNASQWTSGSTIFRARSLRAKREFIKRLRDNCAPHLTAIDFDQECEMGANEGSLRIIINHTQEHHYKQSRIKSLSKFVSNCMAGLMETESSTNIIINAEESKFIRAHQVFQNISTKQRSL